MREMKEHTSAHGLKLQDDQFRLSPVLELNTKTGRFVGDQADQANKFIKREYRKGYEVPELVAKTSN